MSVGDSLRLFMVVVGIVLIWATISSLAKRKMTENVCLAWGLVAVVCILAGVLLRPYGISNYVSWTGVYLIMIIAVVVLAGAFFVSCISCMQQSEEVIGRGGAKKEEGRRNR